MALHNRDVHVWQASLDQTPVEMDKFLHTLSEDERARADRFYFQKDREDFIAARGRLRSILGFYLSKAPESLSFNYSSHGKPSLKLESGEAAIHFNLSHSHRHSLYAIARDLEVGIDLEFIRGELATEEIADRFFSRRELRALRALPLALQKYAFFLCWTRKEAYIKARGEGLSLPLDQFDVSLTPGKPAELLGTRPDPSEASRWSLRDLMLEPSGYAAALAVGETRRLSLTLWQYPSSGITA
jgi:4'-phosphopantetheinyl transferase